MRCDNIDNLMITNVYYIGIQNRTMYGMHGI